MEEITAMLSDDEDDDRLYIAEDIPEPMLPVNSIAREPNATDTTSRNIKENITPIANNEQTIRNNADISPDDIDSLLKNFDWQQFNPDIFDESYEATEQGKEQIESNGARVICKDFARIPFDDDSTLLTREYLLKSELTTTAMSVADVSRNNEMSNEAFRQKTNNFTKNARRAAPYTIPPNTVDENAYFHLGRWKTNIFDFIGNPNTSIPLNNGYGIQGENMRINTPAAQNLNVFMPHPGGPSSTAHGTVLFSNSDKLNAKINNFGSQVMNMHINGPVPVPPHHSQDLYAFEAHRRKMYSDNLAAPSGNYGLNMSACQYARSMRPCAPKNMGFTPRPALSAGYIPRPLCIYPGSCNLHITGPLYPAIQPSVQAQPNIQTTGPLNFYGQALNGNGAIPRDGLYGVEAPIPYATYQQAYLADIRRNSLATGQSMIKTVTNQYMVFNSPVTAINQKPKSTAAANTTRAHAEINPNLSNGGVINVIMQAPLKHERHLDATYMAMQTNEQQTGIHNVTEKFQTSMSTETYKQDSLIGSVDNSVALLKMNKYGAAISRTPISEQLKSPTPFNTFEGKIESIDLTADSITFNPTTQLKMETSTRHDKMSMNINNVQTPKTQHAGMSINSENAQIPLIVKPSSQYADKLQPKMQQASMNMTTDTVKTLITEDNTTQQDNVYKIVETAEAPYIKTCEPLKSELQISGAVIQACNSSELPFTAAKKLEHDSAELESKTNAFNAETIGHPNIWSIPLDKTYLVNKAQAPIKSEHSKINTDEYLQKYKKEEMLITTANPREDMKKHIIQPAVINSIGTTMPTHVNQVKMCMSSEAVQTSMNTGVCIQSANKNSNVQSLLPLVPLNKNTEKEDVALYIDDLELRPNSLKTEPDTVMEVSIQEDTTATNNYMQNAQIPLMMKEYPQLAERSTLMHFNKNQSDVTMQTTIQQTSMDSHTKTVQTPISMDTGTQQASNSANMKALALITSVTQTSRTQTTSNNCNLTYTTSTKNVIHNIASTDFVSRSNNLNPITGLLDDVSRSDTIYDITPRQVTIQHHEILNKVDQFSIDLKDLKSIMDNAHQNPELQNTNEAKTESSAHGVNTHQEKTDVIVTEKEIKNHNENYEGTETIENEYPTGTDVSEGNISCKSENDDENEKLKIARQRLALISMQNENRAVQSTSAKDNPQKSIIGEYDSIIAFVANTANNYLTSYKIHSSEQKKSVNETVTYVTNSVKRSADIKSLETRKRKIPRESAIIDASKRRCRGTSDINNNADEETINSNNELTTQSANIHTQTDITDSIDIEETGKRPEIDFDPIAEKLSIITDGVSLFPTKAKIAVQNNHNKIKLLVQLPREMLKPSTVDSVIKLTHNNSTMSTATNDIYNKDKNCIINREEQKTDSAKTATSTSNPPDKNLNTTINKNYGNVDNNTENPVTIENAYINTNIERSREIRSLNEVETTNRIKAQLPKRNENNTNDYEKNSAESATSRITQSSNKVMNTENTVNMDNNKNKVSRKVRKSLSVENATSTNVEMCEKNINTKTNYNREKNNHKNRKARGKIDDDPAKRPDVERKPKESDSDSQNNTDSRINKYSVSYRVNKTTEKNGKIIMNFINIKTNDNENNKNDNRGSETEDDTKSSSETDDDVNETKEAISNSFNSLKNNSSEKSVLPEVHISGKTKGKISNKRINDAKVKDKYNCRVCGAWFHYPRVYFRHMTNHGIHNERVPENCKYKTCIYCGLEYLQGNYTTHIRTSHNDIFNKKI